MKQLSLGDYVALSGVAGIAVALWMALPTAAFVAVCGLAVMALGFWCDLRGTEYWPREDTPEKREAGPMFFVTGPFSGRKRKK